MADKPHNPFIEFDSSALPRDKTKRSKADFFQTAQNQSATTCDEEDDTETFAHAVGSVTPMQKKGNIKGNAKRGHEASGNMQTEDPTLQRDELAQLGTLEGFKSIVKPEKNKKKSAEDGSSSEVSSLKTGLREDMPAPKKQVAPESGEDETFLLAMEGVTSLSGKGRAVIPEKPNTVGVNPEDPAKALYDLLEGDVEFTLEHTDEYMQAHVEGLDPLILGKMRAGQYSPEGHLDLHGMIASEAYAALTTFIKMAYNKGKRTVLLIPGRGKNSPEGYSVLRDSLERWLTRNPFKRVVLAFCTAQPKDGGAGALYVLLRKYKKSRGKIQWDRTPSDPDLFL